MQDLGLKNLTLPASDGAKGCLSTSTPDPCYSNALSMEKLPVLSPADAILVQSLTVSSNDVTSFNANPLWRALPQVKSGHLAQAAFYTEVGPIGVGVEYSAVEHAFKLMEFSVALAGQTPADASLAVPAGANRAPSGSGLMNDLRAERVSLRYPAGPAVISGLSVAIPAGQITAIIGANGSGKSTLLRGLARLLAPGAGRVLLDGQSIHSLRPKEVVRSLGLLPQGPVVPDGLSVEDLVARGRYPHQSLRRQWSQADEEAVDRALAATRITQLRHRPVDELSGGQRQRAWIALVLAQDTPVMLLDEPTTFLDPAHQLEVLGPLAELNAQDGRTIVLVLHDINQAGPTAHNLIAMRDGQILAGGTPAEEITEHLIAETFGISSVIIADPVTGTPLCVPRALHKNADLPEA